ncbi:MAG: glycosyl hydrolase 53 family protein [Treponema sp.]|nr:glycosyl hydrolase 53 family protein [Treponema sp.]
MKNAKWLVLCVCAAVFASCGGKMQSADRVSESAKAQIAVAPIDGLSEDFIRGVDISMVYEIEKNGGVYYDENGKSADVFQILKSQGVNWVRLRLWNNPVNDYNVVENGTVISKKGDPVGGGNNSVDVDIALAKRAKKAGLKLLLDFHYSDFWADPEKQKKPNEWKNLSGTELCDAVESYTSEVLQKFKSAGVQPDMVQIGNETNNGMLWPDGKINPVTKTDVDIGGMSGFISLLKAASRGVRKAGKWGTDIKIIIHLADGGKNALYRTIFDAVTEAQVDFDIIGLSFYPYWHGSFDDLTANMNDLCSRYGKDMVVVENAYAYTWDAGDDTANMFSLYSDEAHGYIPSVQGQATEVRDCMQAVSSVDGGLGIFYWEPAWIPVEGAGWRSGEGNAWDNQAMFDFYGNVLPSLSVFNLVYGKGEVQNVWGGSASSATLFEPCKASESVKLTVMPGQIPPLPEKAKVVFTDDSERLVPVTWETHDWKSEKEDKIVTVSGTTQEGFRVTCEVELSSIVNLLKDPSFESGTLDEWNLDGSPVLFYACEDKGNAHSGTWAYHYWDNGAFSGTLSKTFTGLQNGTYIFSAWSEGGGGENALYLFAKDYGSDKTLTVDVVDTGWQIWKKYSLEIPVTNGQVTVGFYVDGIAGNWGNFDDVMLYYKLQ